jgi:1-acyl-sn-glycerol-3-phosphate acyltransferase
MPDHEQRRTLFQRLCLGLLSLFGWTSVFEPLPGPKGVIMVYPHTSNWDFFIGILYRYGYGLRAHWMAKHSAFKWPIAGLLRRMGGIPIDRRRPGGAIATMCEEFNRRASMWVAITPEGTRSYTDHIKSGFYRLAVATQVPCALGYIDYSTRTIGIDTYVNFTGDRDRDLEKLKAFYADKQGFRRTGAGRLAFQSRETSPDR